MADLGTKSGCGKIFEMMVNIWLTTCPTALNPVWNQPCPNHNLSQVVFLLADLHMCFVGATNGSYGISSATDVTCADKRPGGRVTSGGASSDSKRLMCPNLTAVASFAINVLKCHELVKRR
jgi:hypothetical protein